MPCILSKREDAEEIAPPEKIRNNPVTKEAAHCVQLHDSIVMLWRMAQSPSIYQAYRSQLEIVERQVHQLKMLPPSP